MEYTQGEKQIVKYNWFPEASRTQGYEMHELVPFPFTERKK